MIINTSQSLSLYFHIPFCIQKCHYCAFLSFVSSKEQRSLYVDDLIHEIEEKLKKANNFNVVTLYFGGGTPTLLSFMDWIRIRKSILSHFSLSKRIEWTVEIHPATINESYILFLQQLGVTRFSFGVQSFNPHVRKMANRKGSVMQLKRMISFCHTIGIKHIGIDLIIGLPGQTFSIFKKDLQTALKLVPHHLSLYFLSIEKGTSFARNRKKLAIPIDDSLIAYYIYACDILKTEKFGHYELSNWARKGKECQHNKQYWNHGNYLGMGLGAHSFFRGSRFCNTSKLALYAQHKYEQKNSRYRVSKEDLFMEYLLLKLRTREGISFIDIRKKFGKTKEQWIQQKMIGNNVIVSKSSRSITEQGWLLLDTIIQDILFSRAY